MPVVVVTDSSACLPVELAEDYGIIVVPLHVLVGDDAVLEGVDEMPGELYDGAATTSAASPGELKVAYTRAMRASKGDGVVAVHLSRHLSGTWEAGRQAELALDDNVRVVDSRGAGMGTGFAALAAARRAAAGGSRDEVYRAAVDVAKRSKCYIVVDRLDQLRRGGRISTAAAVLGTALAMQPVFQVVDGKLALKEKTRTSSKALAKLVEAAVKASGDTPTALAVQHLDAAERAEQIADELRSRIPHVDEVVICEFGPTLGVHLGRGAVGVVVVPGGASFDSASAVDGES